MKIVINDMNDKLDFNRLELLTEEELNEVVDINGSKVFVENGEVKTVLNEEIRRTGWTTVEEARALTLNKIRKIYELKGKL